MSKARNIQRKTKAPKKRQNLPPSQKEIEDRLALAGAGDLKEIVYIGALVEKALMGEFGSVLRALLRGRQAMELGESRAMPKVSAERYLGRIDSLERILEDLEQYVLDKDLAFKKISAESGQKFEPADIHTAPEVGAEELG